MAKKSTKKKTTTTTTKNENGSTTTKTTNANGSSTSNTVDSDGNRTSNSKTSSNGASRTNDYTPYTVDGKYGSTTVNGDATSNGATARVGDSGVNSSVNETLDGYNASNLYTESVGAYQDALSGDYSTNALTSKAMDSLTSAMNAPVTYRNTLGDYTAEGTQLRNDYADYMNYDSVLGKYNDATDAAYALSRQEQLQAMNKAEASNYANTKAGIKSLRDSLVGSASSGANVGASNATALQALLGLGQQNAATTTEGMQAYQNNAKEMAAQRAANATTALEFNKGATDSMYSNATSAYGADMGAMGQAAYGAAEGLGTTASAVDTNQTNALMNEQTIAGNYADKLVDAAASKSAETTKAVNVNKNQNS